MSNQERVAIVTGASSGIGKTTALQLVADGYKVFAAARRQEQIELIKVEGLEPLYMDLNSQKSVEEAVNKVMDEAGRIDVLVNNAGYGLYGTVEETTVEEAKAQFEVNVFGLMHLTQVILPIMRRQQAGHIVNVSSLVGKFGMPVSGWYSASKHALEALSDALRVEVAPYGIKVIVVAPGAIKTGFVDSALKTAETTARLDAYRGLSSAFSDVVRKNNETAADPYAVARVISEAIKSARPRARYVVPGQGRWILLLKSIPVLGDMALDYGLKRRLDWR